MANKADKKTGYYRKIGFSLVEILISVLVVGGILTIMYSGFKTSNDLLLQASFESEAAFLAEREIEYIKSELVDGVIKPEKSFLKSRFQTKPEWKVSSLVAPDEIPGICKILTNIESQNKKFTLESFIYIPNSKGVTNEG
ncbi:MAG: type II secretion system protein [Candidatus Riflebacteria bacterium]|nr:type II secretion system protein [Candidatus Riflebacteria bacterium]